MSARTAAGRERRARTKEARNARRYFVACARSRFSVGHSRIVANGCNKSFLLTYGSISTNILRK